MRISYLCSVNGLYVNGLCKWPILEKILEIGQNSLIKTSIDLSDLKARQVKYLYAISRVFFHQGNYKKSINIAEDSLTLANEEDNLTIKADILWHIGYMWRFEQNKDFALKYLNQAEEIARSINYKTNLVRCFYAKAIIEHGQGHFDKALELYNLTEDMDKNLNPDQSIGEGILDLLRNKGDLGLHIGDENLARDSWNLMKTKALDMCSDHWLIISEARLSLVDKNIKSDQMIKAWTKSLNENLISGEIASAATSYGELAEIYIRNKDNDKAIELCDKSIKLIEDHELDNPHIKSIISYIKGVRLVADSKIDEAINQLKIAQELFAKWTTPYQFWVRDTLKRLGFANH